MPHVGGASEARATGHNGDETGRMVQLEAPHLRLCTWDDSDLERFRPIATDPQVMRFITGGTPWPDERIQLFLRRNQEVVPDGAIPFPRLLATSRDTFLKWSIRPHQCLN